MNEFLKSICPTVLSAVMGPMAGVAVAGIGKIFGLDSATVTDVSKTITEGKITPDQIAQLKALEMQFQADEKERGFRYAELEFKDVQGAREMQIATQSAIPPLLAVLVTIGFFGILIFLVTNQSYKPTEPLLVMLGSLGTAWTGIIAFYFGSSHGSMVKSELLAQSTPAK